MQKKGEKIKAKERTIPNQKKKGGRKTVGKPQNIPKSMFGKHDRFPNT